MATIAQLQNTLKLTFGIGPIVAGLAKFTHLLVHWVDYPGSAKNVIPFDPVVFMKMVGIIEIIAGIVVFLPHRMGTYNGMPPSTRPFVSSLLAVFCFGKTGHLQLM